MSNDITSLVVFCIRRCLKHQVLRKLITIVANMQAGEVNVIGVIFVLVNITVIIPIPVNPPHTGLHQILRGWSSGYTWITFQIILGAYIPCIFEHGYCLSFFAPLMLEKIGIKT